MKKATPVVEGGQQIRVSSSVPTTDAELFLKLLGKDPQDTWFRTITPGKGSNRARGGRDLHGFDAAVLQADNQTGAAVYFITGDAEQATGKNKEGKPTGCVWDPDVIRCRAVFVEWDDRPIEWQVQAWRELGLLEPTVMVSTGGKSVHCYWRLAEPLAPAPWRGLQTRLINYAGGDKQCKNASRLMRLPGFRYVDKTTGEVTEQCAELIHQSEVRYSAAEIEACIPAPGQPPAPAQLWTGELPPRSEADLLRALERVPEFFHDQGRRLELLGLAQRLTIEWGADRAHSWLAQHSPNVKDLAGYFTSEPNQISSGSIWPFMHEHYDVDLKRHDLKLSTPQKLEHPAAPATNKAPPKPKKERKPRKLGFGRAMECFERCVEIQAKRERNSLRRRARLLAIAKALGLANCINRQEIAQRVLEAKDQHQGNSYCALTAADRLSMEWPDVDWLVPGLLPANDLAIIGGRPKVGKTAFAMAIAAAVLKGQSVAGCEAPQAPRPVILVSDDQGDADTVRAMRELGINDHQALLWSRRFRLTEQDLDTLLGDVAQHPGAVVIIDSLRSVARALPHAENDPEIGAVIYDLKAAVTDAGGSLLLVHHCNKSAGLTGVEALSGHNAIAGAANTVLTLHHVEDEKGNACKEAEQRRLVREGRTGKPLDWVISRTAGTPSFHKVGTYAEWVAQVEESTKQAKREARQTHTQGEVLEVLASANGSWLTCREVVEAMGLQWEGRGNGRDPSRVREALNRLSDEGEIQMKRAGTAYTFAAASHGTQLASDTSTTSAELQHKGSERRGLTRQTSAPATNPSSADSCRGASRRRDQLRGKPADPVEVSEAGCSSYQEVAIPGLDLVELKRTPTASMGSAWDAEPA